MTREDIVKRKVTELDKELSVLKKCVAIFCILIIFLNMYHINRLGAVDSSMSSLMKKHKLTSKKISYVIQRSFSKYDSIGQKRNMKKNAPDMSFNYTEEIKPFLDEYVEKVDLTPGKTHHRLFEIANAKLKEEISIYKMPFTKIPDDFGISPFKEQSKLDSRFQFERPLILLASGFL